MARNNRDDKDQATIYDVAQAAGVAPSTVSRAFSRPGRLNADTERRIRAVAEKFGYQPNLTARGLSTGRTRNVGMLVPDVANPFFAEFLRAFQRVAGANELGVLFLDTGEDPTHEPSGVRTLSTQTDGVVLCSPRSSDETLLEHLDPERTVVVNHALEGIASVTIDSAGALTDAVVKLAALGHDNVVYARGPSSAVSDRIRRRVIRREARRHGLEVHFTKPGRDEESLAAAAVDLAEPNGATAILAHSDIAAIWIIHECHRRGLDVPGRISVVGHDNIALGAMLAAPITTVDSHIDRVATAAAHKLMALVVDNDESDRPVGADSIEANFLERESLGPRHD